MSVANLVRAPEYCKLIRAREHRKESHDWAEREYSFSFPKYCNVVPGGGALTNLGCLGARAIGHYLARRHDVDLAFFTVDKFKASIALVNREGQQTIASIDQCWYRDEGVSSTESRL